VDVFHLHPCHLDAPKQSRVIVQSDDKTTILDFVNDIELHVRSWRNKTYRCLRGKESDTPNGFDSAGRN